MISIEQDFKFFLYYKIIVKDLSCTMKISSFSFNAAAANSFLSMISTILVVGKAPAAWAQRSYEGLLTGNIPAVTNETAIPLCSSETPFYQSCSKSPDDTAIQSNFELQPTDAIRSYFEPQWRLGFCSCFSKMMFLSYRGDGLPFLLDVGKAPCGSPVSSSRVMIVINGIKEGGWRIESIIRFYCLLFESIN